MRRGARRGKSIYFLYTTGAGPARHLYMEAAGRPDMARRLWIANLSAGEVRTDRAAILGELFELSGPARSKGRRDRNCAVRDMVTVLEQAVRHCIASVIDMGRARPPAELTLRSVDLPRAAGLSLGVAVSLAFTVSSTAGMRRQFKEFGLPDPFDGNPGLEERVQALLDARHLRTHRMVDVLDDVGEWYGAVEGLVRLLFAALPHGEIDFCLALADYMHENRRAEEAARWYSMAESLCTKAIAGGQNGAEVLALRGLALAGLGRYEEAIASYDEAIAADPGYALAHLNRGLALARLGRHEDAVASYDEAIGCDPSLARAHYSRAASLAALERSDEALASYDAAIELGGPVADAHTDKGDLCAGLERSDEALASYDAAIESDPYAARAHLKKGHLLYRAGRNREAAECCGAAIEIDGSTVVAAEAHAGRGEIAYAEGRLVEALADCGAAVKIDPGLAVAHAGMAGIFAAVGRMEGGLDGYKQAFRAGLAFAEDLVQGRRTLDRPGGSNSTDAERDMDSS